MQWPNKHDLDFLVHTGGRLVCWQTHSCRACRKVCTLPVRIKPLLWCQNVETAQTQPADGDAAKQKQKRALIVKLRKFWSKKPPADALSRPSSAPVRILSRLAWSSPAVSAYS